MAPIINGDVWIELLQFFVDKKKSGLIVFAYQADLDRWVRSHGPELLDLHCFYIPQMQTWRYQSVTVRLCVLTEVEELKTVRGCHFDKVWYMPDVRSDLRLLVEAHCKRLH